MSAITDNRIRIVAALVCDHLGRVLLVRKRGTQAFMQPGGKLEVSESHLVALQRELNEELNCSIEPASTRFLGTFTAPAANEKGYFVEAVVYSVNLTGRAHCGAEIDEIVWLCPEPPHAVELAPLTRDNILPLAMRLCTVKRSQSKADYE